MNNVQLVIPMAGSSEAFADAGYVTPRWLIDIDGKPMIQHVVEQFPGVTDILFICNKEELQNEGVVDVLNSLGGRVVGINSNSNGPVDTILQATEYISDEKEILVSYCDHSMIWDLNSFLEEVRGGDFDGAMTCYTGFHPHLLGTQGLYTFCRQNNRRLVEVLDKRPVTKDTDEFISSDVFYFRSGSTLKRYFEMAIDSSSMGYDGSYFVAPVYNLMMADGLNVCVHEVDKMLLWATPQDLEMYLGWADCFQSFPPLKKSARKHDFTLILPMSGKGKRFSDEGYDLPKPMLPVSNVPMFTMAAGHLPQHTHDIFVCLSEHGSRDTVERYYPDSQNFILSSVSEGYAHSCEIGIQRGGIKNDDPIMVSTCDSAAVYDEHEFDILVDGNDYDVIVWGFKDCHTTKHNPTAYSWIEVDDDGFIQGISCKEFLPGHKYAVIGTMYFRKAEYFLNALERNRQQNIRTRGELCMDSILNQCVDMNIRVKMFAVNHYVCWGTPDDYETYEYWREHFNVEHTAC